MKTNFVVFLTIVFTLYGAINFYIGLRGWQTFGKFMPPACAGLYWAVFVFLVLAYLAGRLAGKYLPAVIAGGLTVTGAYWLAAMNYFFWILVLIDLAGLVNRMSGFLPEGVKLPPGAAGLGVVLLVAGIVIYGAWNSRNPQILHYDLTIEKRAGELSRLHAVVVSDIHLGVIVHNGRLKNLVDIINELDPDLVLLPGDVIDENIGPFVEQKMGDSLSRLKPRYGTFAVFGNHEYIGGHSQEALARLSSAGVTVLRDQYQEVAGSFYVVGRDDPFGERFGGSPRMELQTLLKGVDKSLPVILLDHQPYQLDAARDAGVDLQLSGHTHLGQLFPYNFITRKIFEVDWGYLRKGDFQVIVSCGFGTWGPPIRVGNRPEIIDIIINFSNPSQKRLPG